jgi:Tfp pilus assembly PilM family ATPase
MPLAEIEKWIGLGQNHKEALELTQDTITSLCKEVKSSFDYFEVNKGEHIEKLYLSGGVTYISGIDSLFKDYLGIEVDFLAKAANVNISVGGKDFQNMKNSFSVALGLVL